MSTQIQAGRRHTSTGERGSIPLTLMAIIGLSGIIGALVVSAVGNTHATRFSERYLDAVQAADAGAQEGVQRVTRGTNAQVRRATVPRCTTVQRTTCAASGGTIPASGIPVAGTFDGVAYRWIAEKLDPGVWEIRSTATAADGVARTVVIEIEEFPRFSFAAFADHSWGLAGNNRVDSYDENGFGPTGSTGMGVIGTNGSITLNGQSSVDGVHLYNFTALPYLDRCSGNTTSTGCGGVHAMPNPIPPSQRTGPPLTADPGDRLDTTFISDQLTIPVGQPGSCQALPPPDRTIGATGATLGIAGTVTTLCYHNLTINGPVTVAGRTEIYIYGQFAVAGGNHVNCPSCGPTATPDASRLSIYVLDGAVKVSNGSSVAAGLFAPRSECGGNPSSAHAEFYGSVVCRSINTNGGWAFHYAEQLAAERNGVFRELSWREQ